MAKLSKYTQAQNIVAIDAVVNDSNSPYSFKDWIVRNVGVLPDKETIQYENYVKRWYINKRDEIPTATTVKEDYINLLKQLTLAFKSEADALWCSDINFDDPGELEQVIPFYATKLKEIAIYLINKREAIRHAKLKYNMTGTYSALERVFYEYLLKAFTKRQFPGNEYVTNITDISVLNAIPDLSSVRADFQILVEELYDDTSYFDRDPTLPASAYFTFNESATTYLDSLNIAPIDYEWLYATGVTQLCADNPLLWTVDNVINQYKNGIPLSAVELYDSDVLNDYNRIKLTQKYIGDTLYIISGGYWMPWIDEISFDFVPGNNWFYWLSGENIFENDTSVIIDPVSLSSSNLIDSNATAGLSITSSDIMYVTRDNSLSGAWLRLVDKNTFNVTMSARLDNGKTIFAFPFPGYGLSGEDLLWNGKGLDNLDQTFFYLDKNMQAAVYSAYWNSTVSSISSFAPIYINDTLLVENGAKAAEKFSDADYIISRPSFRDGIRDYIYTDEQSYAWLYKILKTDLPIRIGNNNLYWPFERYDNSISMNAPSNQCEPISLSDVPLSSFIGAVADTVIDGADKIFKKISPNSEEYKEGAWLSSTILPQPINITDSNMASGCYQPGLAMRVLGGSYGSFVWTDASTLANNVFINLMHQDDCMYLHNSQFSLSKEKPTYGKDLNYNQWQDCTCRAIIYSPLGHPGNTFDEYGGMADYIVAVSTPSSSFNFKDWRGIDNKSYLDSNEFGWFKLDGQYHIEPDVGWGSGDWVTNNGAPFMLSAGVMYLYFRNNMLRDNAINTVPYLITRYANTNNQTNWRKLYLDKSSSEWKDAGIITDMVIKPGDMLYYEHNDSYSFTLTSSHFEYSIREVPLIPDFNNFNITTRLGEINLPVSSISIPVQVISDSSTSSNVVLSTIEYIDTDFYGMPTGDITLSASFTNPLTSTASTMLSTITTTQTDYYEYVNESTNFILNVPLYGWNYTTSVYDITSQGARPIWVTASDKDDEYTKQKGIDIWAGTQVLVDDYNFITQPSYSNMILGDNTYIEYNKRDKGAIIWRQPVAVTEEIQAKKWCKILTDTNKTSNLSAILFNNINDIIASATNIPSDIILDVVLDKPLLINYYARNGFTWTQNISNSSLGLPPTGGVWVPVISGDLITPFAPYAHLSNRHYPTYASAPFTGNLYSTKDSGGYMIPRMFGVSTALSRDIDSEVDTSNIDNNQLKREMTAIYHDLNVYNSNRGLTKKDQKAPIHILSVDSGWMKSPIAEGERAGLITHTKQHQEFMPYQTQYENKGINDNGLFRQGSDTYDPWFGDLDITWENDIDWPSNKRKQYDINGWYKQHDNNGQQVYEWKTDIFGNQYAVLKPYFNNLLIYDKKYNIGGSLWTRDIRNIIQPASASMINVFEYLPSTLSDINIVSLVNETSGVLDIDIWFDTIMIYTSAALFFFCLSFDYDTGVISSASNDINYIKTTNSKFGGTWFFEEEKKVTICTLLSCGDQIRPILRSLDLETNQMSYLYNISSIRTDMSGIGLSSYEHPLLTYDNVSKIYNISYLGYSGTKTGMYFTSINICDYGEYYNIIEAKTIIPEA